MKKISKGYYVLAVLLIIWGFDDFYNYATIGKDLLDFYSEGSTVHRMLSDQLHDQIVGGCVKIFLGIGAIFIGWLRMKMKGKERKKIRSLTAITWLLILAIGGIWLVSMRYLTVVTAQEIYDDLYNESYALLKDVERCGEFNEFFDKNSPRYGMHRERPDWLEDKMLEAIDSNTNRKYSTAGKYGNELWGRSKVIREIEYPLDTAVLFYDGNGELLFSSENNLAALAEKLDFPSWANMFHHDNDFRREGIFELDQLLVFAGHEYMDDENVDYASNEEPPAEFSVVTAARSNPLACAIKALRNIYLVTGMLALFFIMVVRNSIAKYLIQPVENIVDCIEEDWKGRDYQKTPSSLWREAEKLDDAYGREREWRRMKSNEIIRLETALNYAKTAEENRRKMVSNIAHELKTPLAIIHSYAEGLREHIAEEKREKYLNVILTEAERSDAMVLEMLDLSRLEAGKVKLSRDDFSLAELTKAVFDKLQLAIQAKELNISFEFPEECVITADESRIAQVVENFASNAIKYTPVGGNISVRILELRGKTSFVIANDCQPFTDEALNKVWDTFYRVDEARSSGGTGLGLAIAKSIVELHGGSCSVRNTKTGVEFKFTI